MRVKVSKTTRCSARTNREVVEGKLTKGKKDKQEFDDERKGRRTALSEGRENYNDHF